MSMLNGTGGYQSFVHGFHCLEERGCNKFSKACGILFSSLGINTRTRSMQMILTNSGANVILEWLKEFGV